MAIPQGYTVWRLCREIHSQLTYLVGASVSHRLRSLRGIRSGGLSVASALPSALPLSAPAPSWRSPLRPLGGLTLAATSDSNDAHEIARVWSQVRKQRLRLGAVDLRRENFIPDHEWRKTHPEAPNNSRCSKQEASSFALRRAVATRSKKRELRQNRMHIGVFCAEILVHCLTNLVS